MALSPEELLKIAAGKAPGLEGVEDATKPWMVPLEHVHAVLTALRDEPALAMKSLMSLTAVDYPDDKQIEVVYHLCSMEHHHKATVKTRCDRENPQVPTSVDIWEGGAWHEREVFDLYGVIFDGHPDLRRILCSDDFVGHPLRKDFEKAKDTPIVTHLS